MRFLQILLGIGVAIGLMWLCVTQYMGRQLYATMPPMLQELPWSNDAKHPAHVPTALLLKPCGELRTNEDLLQCLRKGGLKTGTASDGSIFAMFESGVGFSPTVYRLTWTSPDGTLPMQIDAVRE